MNYVETTTTSLSSPKRLESLPILSLVTRRNSSSTSSRQSTKQQQRNAMPSSASSSSSSSASSTSQQQQQQQTNNTNTNTGSNTTNSNDQNTKQQQQHQHQQQPPIIAASLPLPLIHHTGCTYLSDDGKEFDDVVFDILKVDPDDIAGQLTLIDLPLFKAIQPDELISCKWISREKLVKAPNIVHFTRRFNQTIFWCQREILNCKRVESRGKMISHFIKIAKRLNELHSFNSLMAIIVALKSAPIYRLKKTWSAHVAKRDMAQFERLADLMFDTSDNKRKIRDMHMQCKLPCIPFLGLFLTDLIHIDIAHPHNSFDNPQRRNQMNNICRLISEYQQSNYQDLTSLECACEFAPAPKIDPASQALRIGNEMDVEMSSETSNNVCIIPNCSCLMHHSNQYGGGVINSDGTIYINEIKYVQNYLQSFLYIDELQKFKEEEYYRESLELEPDQPGGGGSSGNGGGGGILSSPMSHSPGKFSHQTVASLGAAQHQPHQQYHRKSHSLFNGAHQYHSPSTLVVETKEAIHEYNRRHHPLDDSLVEAASIPSNGTGTNTQINVIPSEPELSSSTSTTSDMSPYIINLPNSSASSPAMMATTSTPTNHNTNNKTPYDMSTTRDLISSSMVDNTTTTTIVNLNLSKEQQKQLLNAVRLNDSSSLLKELLKYRHQTQSIGACSDLAVATTTQHHHHPHHHHHHSSSLKNKFNCYSSRSDDLDEEDEDDEAAALSSKSPPAGLLNHKSNHNAQNGNGCNKDSLDSSDKTLTTMTTASSANTTLSSEMNTTTVTTTTTTTSNTSLLSSSSLYLNPSSLILFESPCKRKCIIKQYRKPRRTFLVSSSSWKSYWLQLVGGNLLIYYPARTLAAFTGGVSASASATNIAANDVISFPNIEQLQANYQKNPCKMHLIANWMVVQLFEDVSDDQTGVSESSIASGIHTATTTTATTTGTATTTTVKQQQQQQQHKFDIQLNDLNNGNMYKYRFESLELAKQWYEKLKAATTYHERQKPDNLIRFD